MKTWSTILVLCLGAACAASDPPDPAGDPAAEPAAAAPAPRAADPTAGHLPPEQTVRPPEPAPMALTNPEQTGRYDVEKSEPGGAARWTPPLPANAADLARRQRAYLDAAAAHDRAHAALSAQARDLAHAQLKQQILGE